MTYCFVYAPVNKEWSGEIVLSMYKRQGKFVLQEVQKVIQHLYPDNDPDEFFYDHDVVPARVKEFLTRKKNGFMCRRSAFGTFEEILHSEWESRIAKYYPDMFYLKNCADCAQRRHLLKLTDGLEKRIEEYEKLLAEKEGEENGS